MSGFSETKPEPPPIDEITGEFVTEILDYDNGRPVTVYLPPVPPESIVFAGDGQMTSQWGRAPEAADVPPAMIVGVHRVSDETLRLHECSPKFNPERFAAHERLFVEKVGGWVRSRFGVMLFCERTAVFGVSAGGEVAPALGLRHPELYGAIFSASPGGGTGRPKQCRVDCRERISWPADENLFP